MIVLNGVYKAISNLISNALKYSEINTSVEINIFEEKFQKEKYGVFSIL